MGSIVINGERYPLPKQVVRNIKAIIQVQAKQERNLPFHERLLGKIATVLGKPQFLYFQTFFFLIWALLSRLVELQLLHWQIPLLRFQDQGIDVASLMIATGVLIYQSRQEKLSEQRSHLMLQINLLNEQKIAKLIGLVEELRRDLPDVCDRHDWEANIMQQSTDPQVVLNILQENLLQQEPSSTAASSDEERAEFVQISI